MLEKVFGSGLNATFGEEWSKLSPADAVRVARDFVAAMKEDSCTVGEYARRIGRGNLAAYAECLAVQERRIRRILVGDWK